MEVSPVSIEDSVVDDVVVVDDDDEGLFSLLGGVTAVLNKWEFRFQFPLEKDIGSKEFLGLDPIRWFQFQFEFEFQFQFEFTPFFCGCVRVERNRMGCLSFICGFGWFQLWFGDGDGDGDEDGDEEDIQ